MAAEVFAGERISNLGDNDAGVADHDWDKKQPNPDTENETSPDTSHDVGTSLGSTTFKAIHFLATE